MATPVVGIVRFQSYSLISTETTPNNTESDFFCPNLLNILNYKFLRDEITFDIKNEWTAFNVFQ